MSFCGNDYLGLRFHPAVVGAAHEALELGAGAGSSRLVSGNVEPHERAERALAEYVGCEATLLTSSGFAANVGTLPALTGPEDVVFSDALNHASIVDACRLSRARTVVFPHLDHAALAAAVREARPFRRGWVVTESLFSMDGDLAPLTDYAKLAATEDLHMYVDEAHALGVVGPDGRGLCAATSIRPDVLVGTLGKAFGCAGAFVGGAAILRTYLWSRNRSHVFSTGLPPSVAASAAAAVRCAATEPGLRLRLHANITRLRGHLTRMNRLPPSHPDAPILPLIVGDDRKATALSAALLDAGYFVHAIRPPTVPAGTARLRITVSAAHADDELDGLAAALSAAIG